jgi:hypothetical protein
MEDPDWRQAFAEVGMKQVTYLRDPDSLVIEATSGALISFYDRGPKF